MKKLLLILFVSLTLPLSLNAQSIATYSTTGITQGQSPVPTSIAATNVAANASTVALTIAYNNSQNNDDGLSPNSFGFWNNGTAITTLAGAISANSYFTFQVKPTSGNVLNLTGIDLSGDFYSQSGNATFYLESSVTQFGTGASNILKQWTAGQPSAGPGIVALSGFQNISTAGVEFRIYVVEPSAWYADFVGGGAGSANNSIKVNGTVSSAGSSGSGLATYNTTGLAQNASPVPTSLAATNVAANVTTVAMTIPYGDNDNGLTANTFGFWNNGTAITNLAGAISANSYFTFQVKPVTGYVLNLSGIDLSGDFYSQSGNATFFLESNITGFGTGAGNILSQWTAGQPSAGPGIVSLSGFQNISTAGVEFRIYVVEPSAWYADFVGGGSSSANNSIVVNGTAATTSGSAPVISSSLSDSGTVSSAITPYQITATNSPTSYNATGLPPGLSVNTVSGAITGTPTTAGTYAATITASNSYGPGSATLTFTISNASGGSSIGKSTIGVNLTGDWLFADAARQGNPTWFLPNSSSAATTNSMNWPTQDCMLQVWNYLPNNNGTYLLSFTGKATIAINGASGNITLAPGSSSQTTSVGNYDGTNTTAYINITDTGRNTLNIVFTNTQATGSGSTNTGISNVHVWRPVSQGSSTSLGVPSSSSPGGSLGSSSAPGGMFTPDTVALSALFSTTRFMDLLDTNWSSISSWSQRTLPGSWNQNNELANGNYAKGIAYELAVAYCNATGTDLYLTVPLEASLSDPTVSNVFYTNLANLTKYGSDGVNPYTSTQSNPIFKPLQSNLHVYVEYSNEVWNGGFSNNQTYANGQYTTNYNDVSQDAAANNNEWKVLNYDSALPNTDSSGYAFIDGAYRRVALQAKLISDAFRSVYGDAAMPPNANATVRPVLEFQQANGNNTGVVELGFLNDYYNNADGVQHVSTPHPVKYFFWGGGAATYYNSGSFNYSSSLNAYCDAAASLTALWQSGVPNENTYTVTNGPGAPFTVTPYATQCQADDSLVKSFGLKHVAYEGGWSLYDTGSQNQTAPNGVIQSAKATSGAASSGQNSGATSGTSAQQVAQTVFQQEGGDLNIFYTSSSWDPNYTWSQTSAVNNLNTALLQAALNIGTTTPPAVINGTSISGTSATTLTYSGSGIYPAGFNQYGYGIPAYGWIPLVPATRNYQVTLNMGSNATGQKAIILVDGQAILGTNGAPVVVTSPASSVVVGTVSLTAGPHGLLIEGQYTTTNSYNHGNNYNALSSFTSVVLTPQ